MQQSNRFPLLVVTDGPHKGTIGYFGLRKEFIIVSASARILDDCPTRELYISTEFTREAAVSDPMYTQAQSRLSRPAMKRCNALSL